MKLKTEIDFIIPQVPNFIRFGKPKDKYSDTSCLHISDIDQETLAAIADQWKIELLEKAKRPRVEE